MGYDAVYFDIQTFQRNLLPSDSTSKVERVTGLLDFEAEDNDDPPKRP
jgi:hypothetical protein